MTNTNLIIDFIEKTAGITFGLNKKEELKRLIYEILFIKTWSITEFMANVDIQKFLNTKLSGNKRFFALKEILIHLRYPIASSSEKHFQVYLPRLTPPKYEYHHDLSVPFKPHNIYIQNKAYHSEIAKRVQTLFPDAPVIAFSELSDIHHNPGSMLTDLGKRDLYLVEETFDIIKPCPCTKGAVGCNYFILNLGFGCPFDCSYCYLQHYANAPGILLPVNLDSFFKKAEEILDNAKGRFVRIGTGEFFDSLGLDHITGYSKHLVEFFRDKDILFEFKTKSDNIQNLLAVKNPPTNIVISWSVNPQHIIDSDEYYTASLSQRLSAARKLLDHGYRIAFHFDPIIYYQEWEHDYFQVIEEIIKATDGKISWISMGTLRFYRKLKTIVEQRFPANRYFYGEFILDPQDNKMRYPHIVREMIFRKMMEKIKSLDSHIPVYLCMESPDIWKDVTGHPVTTQEIESKFKIKTL